MDASQRPRSRTLVVALGLSLIAHAVVLPFVNVSANAREPHPPDVLPMPPARFRRALPPVVPRPKPRIVRVMKRPRLAPPVVTMTVPHARPARSLGSRVLATALRGADDVAESGGAASTRGIPRSVGPVGPVAAPEPASEPTVIEPTFAPTPVVSPLPACAHVPQDARVLEIVTPDRPELQSATATGRVEVRVDLSVGGVVTHASVYTSSGTPALDSAALDAARRARYAPASDGCKPVAGSYLYTVDFSE